MYQGIKVSADRRKTAAYQLEGDCWIVSLWTAEDDRMEEVARFGFAGPSYGVEARAAKARATKEVAALVGSGAAAARKAGKAGAAAATAGAAATEELVAEFAAWRLNPGGSGGFAARFKAKVARAAKEQGRSYADLFTEVHREAYRRVDAATAAG
jgi:hypothetical protein